MARKQRKNPPEGHGPILRIPPHPGAIQPSDIEAFPEHAKMIGLIVAEWSAIEYRLMVYLALNLGSEARVIEPIIYSIESSGARLKAIQSALLRLATTEKREQFIVRLIDQAKRLLQKRNEYAHALYAAYDLDDLHKIGVAGKRTTHVPIYDLKHQFGTMKAFSHRLALLLGPLLGVPPTESGGPHAELPHLVSLRFARTGRESLARRSPSRRSPRA